jgi:hypothetical protein
MRDRELARGPGAGVGKNFILSAAHYRRSN